jgi:hypothetical protein
MRVRFMLIPAAIMLLAACNSGSQAAGTTDGMASVAPDTIACADAPQLRQRAAEERRRGTESSSDQTRLLLAGRANFLASLAVVAELQCAATTDNEATEALQEALQIARAADATAGFYAQAAQWAEANFAATRAIEILVKRRAATVEE